MLVLIDGWWGSGKSVLRGLLDGHPEVFVSPVQDSVPGSFARDSKLDQWLPNKDTEALRRMLAELSEYYRIERFAFRGSIHNDTSKMSRNYVAFNFDFYEFDALFMRRAISLDRWNPESLCETLYNSMHKVWQDYPAKCENIKGYVTMDNNHWTTPEALMTQYSTAKLLYVKRAAEGVLATRAGRKPVAGDFRSEKWEKLSVDDLLRNGEVEKISQMQKRVTTLQRQFPDRLMILDFEDIVLAPKVTMAKVSRFLKIQWDDCLTNFSYCGKEVVSANGEKYVGKINDRPEDILSAQQLCGVEFLKNSPSLSRRLLLKPRYFSPQLRRELKKIIKACGLNIWRILS